MMQFRFEVEGNTSDYANCFYNVFAKDLREAFKKWNETDGRYVKKYQLVKTFELQD